MTEEPDYPALLRSAIKAAGSSRRALSFQLAEATGNQQSTEYRSLGKYQSEAKPETPTRERAALLAVLLKEPKLALVTDLAGRRRDRLAKLEGSVAEIARVQALLLDELALVVDEQGRLASRPSQDQGPARPKKGAG